ncbi:MAG TPA: response regulator [Limnobacter sp.]|nr:response regulator [Limnobacter sp.]
MKFELPFSQQLEHSPVGLMHIDADGRIAAVNDFCAQLFGYTQVEMLGQPYDCLLPLNMRGQHQALFDNFMKQSASRMMGQGTGRKFFPALHKEGHTLMVQIGLNVWTHADNSYVTLAISDMTDKARLLDELKQGNERLRNKTRELMRVVRQQNHFLNVVSHELRTPLNNSVEMLNQLSATQLDEDQAELFKDLDRANLDVTRSVRMLMDYADSMLGELHLEVEEFDLRELWIDKLRLVQRLFPEHVGLLTTAERFEFDPLVQADRVRLGRMMHGFVANALKFAQASEVRVTIEFTNTPNPVMRFEVCDDGIGMSTAMQRAIGKPFSNHAERLSRGSGGMGVGFYLAKKYLELMNGCFNLVTQEGHGTCVSFEVPLRLVGHASTQAKARSLVQGELPLSNLTLLLVEDDPTVAKINSIRLRKMGAQVVIAGNGKAAVELLQDNSTAVQAILMDLHMPVMDGFAATRQIREMSQHTKTPIVAVTAGSRLAEYARAMAAGIDAFYSKPFEPNVLVHYFKARGVIH